MANAKFPSRRPLYLLVVIPLLLLLQVAIGYRLFEKIKSVNEYENQRTITEQYLRNNLSDLINAETGQRGYLLTGNTDYLEPYTYALTKLHENELLADSLPNILRTKKLGAIKEMSSRRLAVLSSAITLYNAGKVDSALNIIKGGKGKIIMDSIRDITDTYLSQITLDINNAQNEEYELIRIFVIVMVAMIVFQIFFALYSYRKFNEYTNSMAALVDSLEQSNQTMQQFTFMSYHNLKEPLRSIAGFMQLLKKKNETILDAESKEFIDHSVAASKKMERTINEMRGTYLNNLPPNDKNRTD